ncbi:hypothetical protein [Crossiella sp. CA198]|uniref:hypothetical protein n=1 Tax=Crossiella sp. CA198 TaxID=3455607 RepID=UPI003F8D8830
MNPNTPANPATAGLAALAEGIGARLDAHPANQRDAQHLAEITAVLASADRHWNHRLGDPPAEPDYLTALAGDLWRLWIRPALDRRDRDLDTAQAARSADLEFLFTELADRDAEIDRRRAEDEDRLGVPPATIHAYPQGDHRAQ